MKEESYKRLKYLMDINKISQTKLADAVGVSKSMINSYVKGTYKPKQNTLTQLAKFFNVSETWLMGYDVPMEDSINEFILDAYNKLSDNGKIEFINYIEYLKSKERKEG